MYLPYIFNYSNMYHLFQCKHIYYVFTHFSRMIPKHEININNNKNNAFCLQISYVRVTSGLTRKNHIEHKKTFFMTVLNFKESDT
jgi:hypothetical protein